MFHSHRCLNLLPDQIIFQDCRQTVFDWLHPHSPVSCFAPVRSGQFILPIVLCKKTSATVVSEVEIMSQLQNNSMVQSYVERWLVKVTLYNYWPSKNSFRIMLMVQCLIIEWMVSQSQLLHPPITCFCMITALHTCLPKDTSLDSTTLLWHNEFCL